MNNEENIQFDHSGGRVLWLTGFSGAGKSTIAQALKTKFNEQQVDVLVLDGDIVREAIDDPHWLFDLNSRLKGSYRYAKLAEMAAKQGLTVIVPTISMFHEIHEWNRKNITGYFEVYLKVDADIRERRDPKKLYQASQEKMNQQMVGVDLQAEVPISPDFIVENNGTRENIAEISEAIFNRFNQFNRKS